MATERQIRANRANAAKSTGPVTPEGKRASSQNAARRNLIAGTVVYKSESMRRFIDLAADLTLELQPRNSVEAGLVQTMTAARWRLLRMWGMQTAAFELEMARASQSTQASGAVLAAIAFRTLADTSRSFALMHRFEIAYDRQYTRALALLLKLRRASDSAVPVDPPLQLATETRDDDSHVESHQDEPNFDTNPGNDPACNECNEQVPEITPSAPRSVLNPIYPCPHHQGSGAPVPRKQPAIRHEGDLGTTSLAANAPPIEVASPLSGP